MMLTSKSCVCMLLILLASCAHMYSMQPCQFECPKSQKCDANASVGWTRIERFLAYIQRTDLHSLSQEKLKGFFEEGLDPAHQVTFSYSDAYGTKHSRTVPLYKWALHILPEGDVIKSVCKDAANARLMSGIKGARTCDALRYIDEYTVGSVDQYGHTPLYYAIASIEDPHLSYRFVSALLTYGASPYVCAYKPDGAIKASAVMIAALLWRDIILERLLKEGVHLARDKDMRAREVNAWKVPIANASDAQTDAAIRIRAAGNLEKTVTILERIAQRSSVQH